MTHYLDATGLHTDSYETIRGEMVDSIHTGISPVADLSEETPMGALLSQLANRERTVVELAEEVYAGQYPSTADGFQLDLIAAMTGCYRTDPTKSYLLPAEAEVYLDAGVTLPAGSVAHVDGVPASRFVTVADVTNPGGVGAWIACAFEAEETGPVQALTGTLRTVAEPVVGWINDPLAGYAVDNSSDATLGQEEETDSVYRLRRVAELAQGGASTAIAVQADLSAITGMTWSSVLENDGDHTDADGVPGHALAPVVYDGTPPLGAHVVSDDTIAAAILGGLNSGKSGGIRSWGSTAVGITDSQGRNHEIGFTRADVLDVYIDVDLSGAGNYDEDIYPAGAGLEDAVRAALVAYSAAILGRGTDVVYIKLLAVVMSVEGVIDMTSLVSDFHPAPAGVVNLVVGEFQVATIDSGDVNVTV
uniref:Putative baseplate protein n=1 Tax=viral metagenome TaxID=1070528 RepID=A0A6M3JUW8_9ZZZZ